MHTPVAVEAPKQALCPEDEAACSRLICACRLQQTARCRCSVDDGAEFWHIQWQHCAVVQFSSRPGRSEQGARVLSAFAGHCELGGLHTGSTRKCG